MPAVCGCIMKNIVITGSTSGIGKALLEQFAGVDDIHIFAGFRNKDKIELQKEYVEYFYIDLLDNRSIIDAANYIKDKTNKIDVVINIAGSVVAGPVACLDNERLHEQFQVNTFSHIAFVQNLLPVLDGARIVNISSMASFGHFPFISPYCASKRSLDIFFNALAIENHNNLEIVSVKPGVIATPIWEKSVKNNIANLEDNAEYSSELEFLKNNALKNTTKGINVRVCAEKIKKIALKKHVKSSYLIGKDAYAAQLLSYIPQGILNKLIKFAMKKRMSAKH